MVGRVISEDILERDWECFPSLTLRELLKSLFEEPNFFKLNEGTLH